MLVIFLIINLAEIVLISLIDFYREKNMNRNINTKFYEVTLHFFLFSAYIPLILHKTNLKMLFKKHSNVERNF